MYLYELSTTGAITFSDFCIDSSPDRRYSHALQEVTQSRANIRGALKESKRVGHADKDNLKLIKLIEDYIPQLLGLVGCVGHNDIGLSSEPGLGVLFYIAGGILIVSSFQVFSWRTTLSANIFNSSPRLSVPSFTAELAFIFLTYAFSLSNLARSYVAGPNVSERDRTIADADRNAKNQQLGVAVSFLRRASGIFSYVSENVLVGWDASKVASTSDFRKPPDLTVEVGSALAKMSLADAQSLAIRKLLSQSSSENILAPGAPLSKSHPSPMLLAKLHLECASLYSSARSLIKNLGASKSDVHGDVSNELRRYLADEAAFHGALAKKWLGVDSGENGGPNKGGEAVTFLAWAKNELQELKDNSGGLNRALVDKEQKNEFKNRVAAEMNVVIAFCNHYKKVNDTVHFQPVPSHADVQRSIPVGRLVIEAQQYIPPAPIFGPTSLSVEGDASYKELAPNSQPLGTYSGAGSYF
ncbi:hypothetical protein APHAL10511_003641 [Amanita phalloides]|nr:hypothetical protein APHAL10511_003641 [Amanita phalloides]